MKLAAAILLLSAAHASAQVCSAKTNEEMMQDIRAKLGCPTAKPTECKCTGNLQTQYDCPAPSVTLWNSTGQKCVKADSDKDANWTKHANKWHYPARTGNDCAKINIEPGSYDCTKVLIAGSDPKKYKAHEFKNPSAGYNSKYDSESWCTQKSCYVDPCTCNMKDMQSSSWFKKPDGKALYYSGMKCGAPYTFKAKLCSGKTSKDGCLKDAGCKWTPKDKAALLLIDVQDCFLPKNSTTNGKEGSLAVPASHIIPLINSIRNQKSCLFDEVFLSQDFHQAKHISFGSTHGLAPYIHTQAKGGLPLKCLKPASGKTADASCCPAYHINKGSRAKCDKELCPPAGWDYAVNSSGIITGNKACTTCLSNPASCTDDKQAMWTDHCLQTGDATFPPSLVKNVKDIIVKKGTNVYVDAYSAFMDNNQGLMTELDAMLQAKGITTLYVAGVATDYCVHATVRDAFHSKTGKYTVKVIKDATAAVGANKANYDKAIKEMMGFGATMVTTADVLKMACPKAAATTNKIPEKVVKGTVNFEVTLPVDVTQSQFIGDPKVLTGVKKGIAAKLGVSHTWLTEVSIFAVSQRRLSTSRLLAGTKANIQVAFTVTVPAGTEGTKSATSLMTALKGGNTAAEKTKWATNLVNELKVVYPKKYATVAVTTTSMAYVAAADGAPVTSGADATPGMEMYLVMMAIGFANMVA